MEKDTAAELGPHRPRPGAGVAGATRRRRGGEEERPGGEAGGMEGLKGGRVKGSDERRRAGEGDYSSILNQVQG